jgi:hypothetical protein
LMHMSLSQLGSSFKRLEDIWMHIGRVSTLNKQQ